MPAVVAIRLGLSFAVAACLALAACGGDAGSVDQGDSSPTPQSLTVAVPDLPRTLDPALARTPSELAIAAAIHTPLLTYRRSTDTDAATLEPALARSLPALSADDTEYRFTLRPGLLYADGRVVTASDVERSIAHASVKAADPELRAVLDGIVGAPSADGETLPGVVTDDRTGAIVVRLRRPDGRIPFALATPATAPQPEVPSADLKTLPASTGPLRVARVTADSIELVANPLRARIATVPAARAARVSVTSRSTVWRADATGTGGVDLILQPAPGSVPPGFTNIDASSGAVWSLLLPAQGVLASRTVRQAISDAVDRRDLAGVADPTVSFAVPGTGPGATNPTAPVTFGPLDRAANGGLLPACGLLPAFVVGAVVRDDCPPVPTVAKSRPLAGIAVRLASTGYGAVDQVLTQLVGAAVKQLGGTITTVATRGRELTALAAGSADAAIVRADPSLPHPAAWLEPAAAVDDLIARELPKDIAGPLTGSADRWSGLEQRAVQRAVAVPLAVGRVRVLAGQAIARTSVKIYPVLGLDLTALTPR